MLSIGLGDVTEARTSKSSFVKELTVEGARLETLWRPQILWEAVPHWRLKQTVEHAFLFRIFLLLFPLPGKANSTLLAIQ